MKQQFIEHLQQNHPTLASEDLGALISENLLSPFEIRLPKDILSQAQNFVRASFHLRSSADYLQKLKSEMESRGIQDPGNKSICMSYDFHVDADQKLKLIEVNTNASFLAMGYEMYRARKMALPVSDFKMEELAANIRTELELQGKKISQPSIAIIDDQPSNQRLYIEFLLYNSFFQQWGMKSRIQDFRENIEADFVYNRHTDFYLENPEAAALRKKFLSRENCFSPNPFEYLCLADKQRMIDWAQMDIPEFKKNLPAALDLTSATADQIWSDKKKYFLKPKRAFGAKQSYRGASVSHKVFLELIGHEFIAQEFIPAQEKMFTTPTGDQSFKYDLRFYAYQDRVQLVAARLYQGQVTNLRTPFGGFAPVIFE